MKSTSVTIEIEHGLHVRPSAQFVEKAKQFESEITIECANRKASGKSIFHLQTLDLTQGAIITLFADGPDEDQALEALTRFLEPSRVQS